MGCSANKTTIDHAVQLVGYGAAPYGHPHLPYAPLPDTLHASRISHRSLSLARALSLSACVRVSLCTGYCPVVPQTWRKDASAFNVSVLPLAMPHTRHHPLLPSAGTEGPLDYWLVRNSWGAAWGDVSHARWWVEASFFKAKLPAPFRPMWGSLSLSLSLSLPLPL